MVQQLRTKVVTFTYSDRLPSRLLLMLGVLVHSVPVEYPPKIKVLIPVLEARLLSVEYFLTVVYVVALARAVLQTVLMVLGLLHRLVVPSSLQQRVQVSLSML